jgi:hypothetical protein
MSPPDPGFRSPLRLGAADQFYFRFLCAKLIIICRSARACSGGGDGP